MKRLFTLLLISIAALSCEMIDEKFDDLHGKDDTTVAETIPHNQIWYTSTDGEIVEPNDPTAFNVSIISNTYENGKGVITFNGNVTEIGEEAFDDCDSLTSVTIPDSVTTIGVYAFAWCNSIVSVTLSDNLNTIGEGVFGHCESLISVTIPDSLTTIGHGAFYGCSSLINIVIPINVNTILGWAFYGCSSLTSAIIPDSVNTIGDGIFTHCDSLTEFKNKFASEDDRCLIVDGVLNSFAPAGLTEYTIPDSVTTIGESAFEKCTRLTSVIIPNRVTTIGKFAFFYCSNLASVTIPDSVNTIGKEAFCGCDSLTSVYCKATTPPTVILDNLCYWGAFDVSAPDFKIYVPAESVDAYKSAEGWKEYANDIVGYNF